MSGGSNSEVSGAAASGPRREGNSTVRKLLRVAQLGFGFTVLLIAGYWIGVGDAGMASVSLVRRGLVYPAANGASWTMMTVLIGCGIAACVTPTSLSGTARRHVDFAQLTAAFGLLCLIAAVLPFVSGLEFTGPGNQCIYVDCWPRPYQELLIASPFLLAAVGMSICGIIGSRMPWTLRSIIPAVIFASAAAVQLATWQSVVLPFLGSATPIPL